MNALKPTRDIQVTVTGKFPLDGHKAVMQKVQEFEQMFEYKGAELVDITAETSVVDTKHPFKIYVFTVTTKFSLGEYTFAYVESVPNVEGSETLNPAPPEGGA